LQDFGVESAEILQFYFWGEGMKPRVKPQDSGVEELFRSKLKNIINMRHELVRLAGLIDWARLEAHFAPYYSEAGRPGLPIRLVVGLHLLKHIEGLSDEAVCERWERDPYMQYFCGEEYFQHSFPLERSGMTHFRRRVGEQALETLLQETLAAAHRAGALSVKATEAVAVDTTVQEKAIAHPTEHGLLLTAIEQLGAQAKKTGLRLRQSYVHVARRAAMKTGRYLHAQQKKRAKRQLKFLRVRLRRLLRDVRRKMAVATALSERQAKRLEIALAKAWRIAQQRRGDPGYLYSWHATEVECISKGKARAPYEFGCKVSLATNLHPAKGGHFILHAQALHGNPYDGHTLAAALEDIRKIVGRAPQRVAVDQGYKGHRIALPYTAVYITGQRRGVTEKIKRWLKRRAVVEPVIGHAKNDGLLGRNWLGGRSGDRSNALLAAVGFNLRQLLRFLKRSKLFLCLIIQARLADLTDCGSLLSQEAASSFLSAQNFWALRP
jgi:transposase, IS5 family